MSEVRFSLRLPSEDGEWCGLCAAFYKAAVIAHHEQRIKDIEGDGKTDVIWISDKNVPGLPHLAEPVITGQSHMAPVLGATRLCWSHLPALTQQASLLDVASGPLPPGLIKGRG